MLVVMQAGASPDQVRAVEERVRTMGFQPHAIPGAERVVIGVTGNQTPIDPAGVRTFVDHSRNILDLAIIPSVKAISHLPILADPSHGTGRRDKVMPLALAAIAAGADGVMVEVHHEPRKALSDGPQALLPGQFKDLVRDVRALARLLGRERRAEAR